MRAVPVLVVVVLGTMALNVGSALATETAFTTPGCTTWSVPKGVSSVGIVAMGSAGFSFIPGAPGVGGSGDEVSGMLSGLGTGETLDVCVNFGGGGANNGMGGGASGVALGGDFSTPALVAGGGGGAALFANGGSAGLPVGGSGAPSLIGGGGGNNTTMSGGSGGAAGCPDPCSAGGNGSQFSAAGPGVGGSGAVGPVGQAGGGGGGYFGGGGGGSEGGGGGGGSDWCASTLSGASLSGCQVTGSNSTFGSALVTLTYASTLDFLHLSAISQHVGPGTSLVDKATNAQAQFEAGNTPGACGALGAYVHEVNAQSGKSIARGQASGLVAEAQGLQTGIGCRS